ncbi:hypothetical protein QBC44DRAFT_312453 [Cladorrhinum sp. PSN332]|nr:hypothetical protein QBC44DRAFT_312453 [Cladorrhinum sp. PSN332]
MIPQEESRTAILAVLLVFETVIFIFELLHLPGITPNTPAWLGRLRACLPQATKATAPFRWLAQHLLAPTFVGLVAVPLFAITFSGQGGQHPDINNGCTTNLDADIAGDGVRASVWVQGGVLLFIALTGTFHPFTTGIKEVGGGLVITHISLAIALAVQMGRRTLSSVDAVIGCLILDAQNSALSVQLAGKETLAARWQAMIVMLAQLFGLIILPIIISRFGDGSFAAEECECFSFFWWGWLSDCPLFPPSERRIFWIYYSLRCLFFVQCAFHTLWNTRTFDEAEKIARGKKLKNKGRSSGSETDNDAGGDGGNGNNGSLDGITYPDPIYPPGNEALIKYVDYPATATLMYVLHGVTAITSMAVCESIIRDYGLRASSQVYSVGQVIALVVAGSTVLRALWLFLRMFREGSKSWKRWKEQRRATVPQDPPPPPSFYQMSLASLSDSHDSGGREDQGEEAPVARLGSAVVGSESLPNINDNPGPGRSMMSRRNTMPPHVSRSFRRSESGASSQLEKRCQKSHRFGIIWPFTLELATVMYFRPQARLDTSMEEQSSEENQTRENVDARTYLGHNLRRAPHRLQVVRGGQASGVLGTAMSVAGPVGSISTTESEEVIPANRTPPISAPELTAESQGAPSEQSAAPEISKAIQQGQIPHIILTGSAADLTPTPQKPLREATPRVAQAGPLEPGDAETTSLGMRTEEKPTILAGAGSWIPPGELEIAEPQTGHSGQEVQAQAAADRDGRDLVPQTGLGVGSSTVQFWDWVSEGVIDVKGGSLVLSSSGRWSMVSVPSYFFERSSYEAASGVEVR